MSDNDIYVFPDKILIAVPVTKVRPGVVALKVGQQMKIRNLTDKVLELQFDPEVVKAPSRIDPKGKGQVRIEGGDGLYEYHVIVDPDGSPSEAIGESAPKMIIDP